MIINILNYLLTELQLNYFIYDVISFYLIKNNNHYQILIFTENLLIL